MAGLFGNLPAPTAANRIPDPDEDNDQEKNAKRPRFEDASEAMKPDPTMVQDGIEQPVKDNGEIDLPAPAMTAPNTTTILPKQPSLPPEGQVTAALQRITSHISNPKKFPKASELLRQLFSQGVLEERHGVLVFEALSASMKDPSRANDPMLAREYSKLFAVASKHPELFSPSQRSQLDVYGIWAVLRNQMTTTDDSFIFSKTVNTIKDMITDLPQLYSSEEEEIEETTLANPQNDDSTREAKRDIKGNTLNTQEKKELEVVPSSSSSTWSDVAVVAHRRAALVACIEAGRECYGRAWARTSVDLLIDHAAKNADSKNQRFLPNQRPAIQEMVRFMRDQKTARKLGPSGKETARDSTAFERAREEWGRAAVSHRGKVGNGGDHKSEAWLG